MPPTNSQSESRHRIYLSSFVHSVVFRVFHIPLPRSVLYGTVLLFLCFLCVSSEPSPETFVTVVEAESDLPNTADCPISCDLAQCPRSTLKNEDTCPSGTRVLDTCGCCPVCLRTINESCGGKFDRFGICSNGLRCQILDEISDNQLEGEEKDIQGLGICSEIKIRGSGQANCEKPVVSKGCNFVSPIKGCVCREISACAPVTFQYPDQASCQTDYAKMRAMWSEECLKAKCAVVFQPKCADDSFLVVQPPEPPDCCQKIGSCECNQKKCLESVPKCNAGFALTRVKRGTNQPGHCCDIYECKKRVLDCEGVICPLVEILECPQDSYRPPRAVIEGTCCMQVESCKCSPGICAPAHCPPGHTLKVLSKGDGSPGNCCDEFECAPNTTKAEQEIQNSGSSKQKPKEKPNNNNEFGGVDSKHRRTVEIGMNPISKPCLHEGGLYRDGQKWYPNLCSECECVGGLTFCRKMTCPRVPESCTWVETGEKECCPLCLGCVTEDGRKVNLTETWDRDDCTTCTCGEAGTVLCQTQLCRVTCDNPVKVDGQCCPICEKPTVVKVPPVCPSIEHCPLRCEYGLKKDDRGCFVCFCHHIEQDQHVSLFPLSCQPLTQDNCIKKCAHGYVHDENGCATCKCAKCPPLHQCYKHCLYGFQTNAYGCPVCKCKSGLLPTAPKTKDGNNGSFPSLFPVISSLERPFPQEKSLFGQNVACESPHGQKHDSGEWWHDGCRHCYCEQGWEFCSLIACPKLDCHSHESGSSLRDPGQCCPRCRNETTPTEGKHSHTVCHAPGSGRLFVDGETWDLTPCVKCTCRVGHVLCYMAPCPPVVCAKPVKRGCCEVCEESDSIPTLDPTEFDDNLTICTSENGVAHVEGSTWRVDECTSCVCKDSGIECFPEVCQSPVIDQDTGGSCRTRPLRIKGRCCPMCTDSLSKGLCEYENSYYSIGEQWKNGACINCTCSEGGQTLCTKLECPPCHIPKETPGKCCPICEENVPSWSLGPTLYPNETGNYNETQQINLILLFSVLGLALIIVLAIVAVCLCYRKCRSEERKKVQLDHNGADPQVPIMLPQAPPGLTVTTSGPLSGPGSFSAKLLRVKEPRSEQSESLLSATSNGSSGSSANGVPTANGCARAASFNMKKISAPCSQNEQRPRSCKV